MKSTPSRNGSAGSTGISRRELLTGTAKLAGAAALLSAVRTAFPSGVWAAPADTPETQRAVLGFIALTDSSPADHRQGEGAASRSTACPTSRC